MNNHAEPVVLRIDLGERGYPIVIGGSLISDPTLVCQHVTARDVMVVTNEIVGPLYLETLARSDHSRSGSGGLRE